MQYLVLAYDNDDEGAPERRMESREDHIKLISEYKEKGNMIMGAALLDDDGKMIGSSIIVDFPNEEELHEWLEKEPYVLNDVWGEANIMPCAVAPSFVK